MPSGEQGLLAWTARHCRSFGVTVTDFRESFIDGRALCALVCSHAPKAIDFDRVSKADVLPYCRKCLSSNNDVMIIV